jgi:translation initiation factor IF-2
MPRPSRPQPRPSARFPYRAINKIDKQNANIDKVTKELAEQNLIPEDWGGTTLFARISAKKKEGIKELLELIVLQSEMLELKANPDKLARGTVIESELDRGHGPVGTVIIQDGTLKIQDPFISGMTFAATGHDRRQGTRIQIAPAPTPLLVVGCQMGPMADRFIVTTRRYRRTDEVQAGEAREREALKTPGQLWKPLFKDRETERYFHVIVKGDVRVRSMRSRSAEEDATDSVEDQITHSGLGAITETESAPAMASGPSA